MTDGIRFEYIEVHRDERGWVSELYSGSGSVTLKNIHFGSLAPGVIRGNHVHRNTREWIGFVRTPILVRWGSPEDGNERKITDPVKVHLPVGVPHAFKNISDRTVTFGAYTDTRYNSDDPDVERVELFENSD